MTLSLALRTVTNMGKFAAYLNLALAVAWTALFFTNDALFVLLFIAPG